ncbi:MULTISPECIES: hypothetical protein [Kitasatospora]|uniref:Uncharacterized protein n=1 Tax=Kitasatospora setae (strain ATCC 33774 / DSM 43861 / JCM 3304 / KCC A-0304 / NBRC 14216 / KM-6054) TaxID=452652 RepID=E4NFE7_KITSK|nr:MULTISPECIES: hypothetical protein [Kitasatospora]BAJ30227.1 hypothetical protein KSE_44440 [Kitasatospora setae KM-6054]
MSDNVAAQLVGRHTNGETDKPPPFRLVGQDKYRAAAERAARRLPTPEPVVVVAYLIALLVLPALATVLILSGRT